jgi:hypothetical protein
MQDRIELIKTHIKEGSVVAEIGVQTGWLTDQIMIQKPWYVGIDCWENFVHPNQNDSNSSIEYIKKIRTDLMFKYAQWKNVWLLHEFSAQAVSRFTDNYFDFIYIDGDHNYKAVKNDINIWWPKVKAGGILSGHDYCDTWGVKKAVDEFCEENKLTLEVTTKDEVYKTWFIKKQ